MQRLLHAILLFVVIAITTTGCSLTNGNFRAVDEGVLYRSGQLRAEGLEGRIERHDITTIISLRNPHPEERWYMRETEICRQKNVQHVNIPWSKEKLPSPESLTLLLKTLDKAEGPVLVHCQGGVHRSAVASALYLLREGESVEVARDQFGLFFNNAPIGTLIDLYEENPSDALGEWLVVNYPRLYEQADLSLR